MCDAYMEKEEDGKSFFAKMRDASIVFGNWDKTYGCRPIPSRDFTGEIPIPSVSITEQHSVQYRLYFWWKPSKQFLNMKKNSSSHSWKMKCFAILTLSIYLPVYVFSKPLESSW